MRNLTWGFILIIIGVLILLDNLGVADFGDMVRDFWPVLLILWGVSVLIKRRRTAATATMPAPPVAAPQPAAVHSETLSESEQMIREQSAAPEGSGEAGGERSQGGSWTAPGSGASGTAGGTYQAAGGQYQYESELLHQSSVFGDIRVRVTSTRFKGGSISTVFGSSSLDLYSAKFADGEHELRIHGVFGESRLILPKDAAVAISANTVMGDLIIFGQHKGGISSDIQHMTPGFAQASSRLRISITRIFGSIRVD
jgi:predicted membrane protein